MAQQQQEATASEEASQEATANVSAGKATAGTFDRLREWSAQNLGVPPARKEELYIEILKSASLRDASYWLQVVFSAGIATLGLVLNSVAVIIGAMLISPLMNPILASGLALAAGDLILAIRALINLTLSCLVAISFAVLLIFVLPFKEMTAEIAARTQPNTLDLVVALFSGAVGSIAICKEVKGVVTSIPGVAIAVALMPPLCVTGYGIGIALSHNSLEGWRVARGGGLLFLTNLVAITFTAMVVFLLLHIDTKEVNARVREWRKHDKTSRKLRLWLKRLPEFERLKTIGSLPARLLLILTLVLLLLVPLTQSLGKLKRELAQKRRDNLTKQAATDVWQQNFAQYPDGTPRCYLGGVTTTERNRRLDVLLRVFTGKPYTVNEEAAYVRRLAARLGMSPESIALNLIEVPTTANELLAQAEEEKAGAPTTTPADVPNVAATQAELLRQVGATLDALNFPAPAQLAGHEILLRPRAPLEVRLSYLSPREISADAQAVLTENLRAQLADVEAQVSFAWIATARELPAFGRNQSAVTDETGAALAPIAEAMRRSSVLRVRITAGFERNETEEIARARVEAVAAYFSGQWQIPASRITQETSDNAGRNLTLRLEMPDEER